VTPSGRRGMAAGPVPPTSASQRSRPLTSGRIWPGPCAHSCHHGDDDQIVRFEVGQRSAELIAGAVLKVYQASSQALTDTDRDRLDPDLLEFINPLTEERTAMDQTSCPDRPDRPDRPARPDRRWLRWRSRWCRCVRCSGSLRRMFRSPCQVSLGGE
jgi:hypothetical protein